MWYSFFFSSRRRHTRCSRDWSSDVCSSDLPNYDLLEHEFVALTALQMTTFTSLLPWMGEAGLRGDAEWPCYLEGLVDPETGALRTRELAERLTQVKRARRLDRNLR